MNLNLEGVAKAVYVGFLLILWAVLIRLGISDAVLIDFIKALIGVVVGWHGINEWGGTRRAAAPLTAPDTLPPVRQTPPPMPAVAPAARADGTQQ